VEIDVVLVRSRYAGNVGSAVRAAANFDATRVVLVHPSCGLDEDDFIRMAMGANELVEVSTATSLAAAVADAGIVVATTSGRARDPRPLLGPDEVRAVVEMAGPDRLALVFGPERGGLSRSELRACGLLLSIATNPTFPVLNLGHAVAVVLAILRSDLRATAPRPPLDTCASSEELAAAFAQLENALADSGFLDPVNPSRVMDQLRRWLARAAPTAREVTIMRGIASHIAFLNTRSKQKSR